MALHSVKTKWSARQLYKFLCSVKRLFSCSSTASSKVATHLLHCCSQSLLRYQQIPTTVTSTAPSADTHSPLCTEFMHGIWRRLFLLHFRNSYMSIYERPSSHIYKSINVTDSIFRYDPDHDLFLSSPITFDFEDNSRHKQNYKWHF